MDYVFEPKGQSLEIGLIQFLIDNEIDVQQRFIERNKHAEKLIQLPFDQNLKRKTVVRRMNNDKTKCRVYVKGAPEYIFALCNQTLNHNLDQIDFYEHKEQLLEDIIGQDMAGKQCLKVISYAFKEIEMDSFNELMRSENSESAEFREEIESDLIYLGTFGVKDELIEDIHNTVQLIRYGKLVEDDEEVDNQVNVRMVTGDHLETAKQVAIQAGIITESEANTQGVCMTGDQFTREVGDYENVWDEGKMRYEVKFDHPKKFKNLKKTLRVIARTTAEIKYVFVSGIK